MSRMLACGSMPLGVFLLTGCATPADNAWTQNGSPPSQMQQDLAECKYEAEQATATIGTTGRTPKTFSDAISEGAAAGVVKGMEQDTLVKSCMKTRGYKRGRPDAN